MSVLVASPIPYEDESPLGLIYRTAAANGIESSKRLLTHLEIMHSLTTVVTDTGTLVNCKALNLSHDDNLLCYKPTRTHKSTYQFNHIHVDRRLLQLNKRRCCTPCLEEHGYVHYTWDYQLVTVCPTHAVTLASQCSKCGIEFDWSSALLNGCQCGGKITHVKTTQEAILIQNYIINWIENGDQEKVDILEDVFFSLETIALLHGITIDNNKRIALAVFSITDTNKFTKAVTKVLRGVMLFPRLALYPLLQSKQSHVQALADSLLNGYKFKYKQNDVPAMFLNQHETAIVLNISTKQVQQLLQKQIITAEKTSKKGNWKIALESINELLNNLQSLVTKASSKKNVPIAKILAHPLHHQNIGEIIEASLINQYPIAKISHSQGLLGISFGSYQSPKVQSMLLTDDYLTIKQAAAVFKHKEHHLSAIVNTPYLSFSTLPTNSTLKLIKREDIELFDAKYVIGPELAADTSHSRTSFCPKLIAHGITPVSGPRIDNNPCYIFKREDLVGVNFDEIEKITLVNTPNRPGRPLKSNSPITTDALPYVNFNDIKKKLNIDTSQLRVLLKHKLLTKHPDYRHKPVVSRSSFDSFVHMLTSGDYLILNNLLSQLKMTSRSFNNKFVLTGICFIKDVYLEKLLPRSRYKEIINFHNTYLTTAEANLLFPGYSNQITNLEKRGLITPTLIPKVTNNGHTKVWKKADVDEQIRILNKA